MAPKKPKMPKPVPGPTIVDPRVEQEMLQMLLQTRKKRGFSSTILTGGMGVQSPAPVRVKTLLRG